VVAIVIVLPSGLEIGRINPGDLFFVDVLYVYERYYVKLVWWLMTRSNFSRETVDGWSRLRPDEDLFGLGVAHRLIWSGRLAEEILERTAIASGLRRRGDYEVLALLRRAEPELLSPLQVAQQLITSQSGMTGKLDRLERQGLVQRSPDPEDRRAIRLGITDAGRSLIDQAFTTSLSVYQSMLDGFTPTEGKDLDALLDKLLARLDGLSAMQQPWNQELDHK
jgi:DNA-binding MarR family transcriptional regulator